MKHHGDTPPGEAGFTLVETLVALIILGFIVVGLSQGLHFGMAAWDRQVQTIDRDSALDSVDRTLRALLARMAPGDDPHQPTILGRTDALAFTAQMPANAPAAPTRLADILLRVDGRHRLVLWWTPHLHARLLQPVRPQQVVLLSDVRGLRFAYYQRAANGRPPGWVARYQAIAPPELIRLHIDFGGDRHWPDMIVAPMRQVDDD